MKATQTSKYGRITLLAAKLFIDIENKREIVNYEEIQPKKDCCTKPPLQQKTNNY